MDVYLFSNLYYIQALFKIKIVSKSFLDKIIKAPLAKRFKRRVKL